MSWQIVAGAGGFMAERAVEGSEPYQDFELVMAGYATKADAEEAITRAKAKEKELRPALMAAETHLRVIRNWVIEETRKVL